MRPGRGRAGLALLALAGCAPAQGPPGVAGDAPPVHGYEVVAAYAHDPDAFTQGLVFAGGRLFESTGLNGESSLREVRLETGEVLRRRDLPAEYFGEGLTLLGQRLFQLTWVASRGFVYDAASFDLVETFAYAGEGWGLTHDGRRLILSDGTSWLRFLDPDTRQETGRIQVTDRGRPLERVNELEFIDGRIWANVWLTDRLALIDPADGRVTAWVDLAGLLPGRGGNDVLNGIAWDADGRRLFVTGKRWPRLFEIRPVPPVGSP